MNGRLGWALAYKIVARYFVAVLIFFPFFFFDLIMLIAMFSPSCFCQRTWQTIRTLGCSRVSVKGEEKQQWESERERGAWIGQVLLDPLWHATQRAYMQLSLIFSYISSPSHFHLLYLCCICNRFVFTRTNAISTEFRSHSIQ